MPMKDGWLAKRKMMLFRNSCPHCSLLHMSLEGSKDVVECDGRDDDYLVTGHLFVCTNMSSSLSGTWCWPPDSITMCIGCIDAGLLISTVWLSGVSGERRTQFTLMHLVGLPQLVALIKWH